MTVVMSPNTTNETSSLSQEIVFRWIITALYACIFFIGVIGNLWVISVVLTIFRSIRRCSLQNISFLLYIFSLSIVDTFVLLNLPLLVFDIFFGRWMFGEALCKTYWISESVNKLLSKFILTAMSFDRYLAVCKPNSARFVRSAKGASTVLFILGTIVFVVMYPVYEHAHEILLEPNINYSMNSSIQQSNNLHICILTMSDSMILYFTCYMFVLGFCLPSLLITYFYFCILRTLYAHAQCSEIRQTQIPIKRVTRTTLILVLFYFFCWAPFWSTVMHNAFQQARALYDVEVYIAHVVHFLVYVNSASNWVLYALANNYLKDAKEQVVFRRRIQSSLRRMATFNANISQRFVEIDATEIDESQSRNRCRTMSSLLGR